MVHSNGENLILGGLGSWQPMGHVDFYPNGGRMQKGCSNLFVGAVSDIIWCKETFKKIYIIEKLLYFVFVTNSYKKNHNSSKVHLFFLKLRILFIFYK